MTRIPVFSYSSNLVRYWRRKGDWRQSQEPDETAYIPCRNVETVRGDLAEFLLQVDPKTNVFFDGDYGELVDIVEVRQAAQAYGWRQRSAQFKEEIGLGAPPTPPPSASAAPSPSPAGRSSWSSSWEPRRSPPPDRPDPQESPAPSPTATLPPAFFDLLRLLDQSSTSTKNSQLLRAFEQLHLPPTTDWERIQRAYRDRSRATHPDQGGNRNEFQGIQEAYDCLKRHYHPRRRPI